MEGNAGQFAYKRKETRIDKYVLLQRDIENALDRTPFKRVTYKHKQNIIIQFYLKSQKEK